MWPLITESLTQRHADRLRQAGAARLAAKARRTGGRRHAGGSSVNSKSRFFGRKRVMTCWPRSS